MDDAQGLERVQWTVDGVGYFTGARDGQPAELDEGTDQAEPLDVFAAVLDRGRVPCAALGEQPFPPVVLDGRHRDPGPQIQRIDGAPGSTSTIQGDDITMYVESLTGTLSGVEDLPAPPVPRLHLTPDTVPEWLYDTVGNLGLKLQLRLGDAESDQAGQTGGKLVIPGIHGCGTPR